MLPKNQVDLIRSLSKSAYPQLMAAVLKLQKPNRVPTNLREANEAFVSASASVTSEAKNLLKIVAHSIIRVVEELGPHDIATIESDMLQEINHHLDNVIKLACAHLSPASQVSQRIVLLSSVEGEIKLYAAMLAKKYADEIPSKGVESPKAPPRSVHHDEPLNRMKCEGATWRIAFNGGREFTLKNQKGVRCLARLLGAPGRDWSPMELEGVPGNSLPPDTTTPQDIPLKAKEMTSQPILDAKALKAVRNRLKEIEEEQAECSPSSQKHEKLESEKERIVKYLSQNTGPGGRIRVFPDGGKRTMDRVAKAINKAIDQIAQQDEHLAEHLRKTIRTGNIFRYAVLPENPAEWVITGA